MSQARGRGDTAARSFKIKQQALLDAMLHEACKSDDMQGARKAIEAGANIEKKNAEGRQPLYIAAENNSLRIAILLAERGANMSGCKRGKRTALHAAVAKKYSAMVVLLVKRGSDVNAQSYHDGSILYSPACYADQQTCLLLVSLGADPANNDNESALTHYGIYADPQLSSAEKAARINEMVSARAKYLRASKALIKACTTDDVTKALAAIEDGADVEFEHKGHRPLFVTALLNSLGCAALLAERGANMSGCKAGGDSALFAATINKHPEMIKLLAQRGADMNAQCSDFASILHYPSFLADHSLCLLLVSLGTDPAVKDKNHRSALTHYGTRGRPQLPPTEKAARVAELVAARAEYVERARRQTNWSRRRFAMLFLQGSGFRPSETQRAAQRLEQQQVDTHAHIPPTVLDTKEKRVAHLVSKVLSMEGLSRNVVSFL